MILRAKDLSHFQNIGDEEETRDNVPEDGVEGHDGLVAAISHLSLEKEIGVEKCEDDDDTDDDTGIVLTTAPLEECDVTAVHVTSLVLVNTDWTKKMTCRSPARTLSRVFSAVFCAIRW